MKMTMTTDWGLETVFAPNYIPGAILPGFKETLIPGHFTGLKWVSGVNFTL